MARVARVAHVYFDRDKKRHFVERRIPDDVQMVLHGDIKGRKRKHTFPQAVGKPEAEALGDIIVKEWESEWVKIVDRAKPPVRVMLPGRPLTRVDAMRVAVQVRQMGSGALRHQLLTAIVQAAPCEIGVPASDPLARPQSIIPPANQNTVITEVVDSLDVIDLWIKKLSANHTVKAKSIKRKHAVIRDLFKFLGVNPIRHVEIKDIGKDIPIFDLTQADDAGIQRYKDSLDNSRGFDRIGQIVALYEIADENRRFRNLPGGNPAVKIVVPSRPKSRTWHAYSEDEAKTILEAARTATPEIRWTLWLSAFLGTIVSEVADRRASDFKKIDGIDVIDIPDGKTDYRPRVVPVHGSVRREGFYSYLDQIIAEHGPDAPLFPHLKPNADGYGASVASRCRSFVRSLGITESDKQLNGMRKRYATQLEDMDALKSDRQRYMTGHAPRDVHAKNYLNHPVAKTKPFIDLLVDPTKREIR